MDVEYKTKKGDVLRRVLLVDDSSVDAMFIKQAFDDANVSLQICIARNGREALSFLRRLDGYEEEANPDLILLDLNMPKLGGLATLHEIKSDRELRRIPVLMLTTSRDPFDVRSAYDEYVNSYIPKPRDYNGYADIVASIRDFWFSLVKLPSAV